MAFVANVTVRDIQRAIESKRQAAAGSEGMRVTAFAGGEKRRRPRVRIMTAVNPVAAALDAGPANRRVRVAGAARRLAQRSHP
ncbi:MAG TPA: hypothetical protein VMU50_14090 [Polyangia bacterium]|nr:hypothetical protein [Polyangia bacterium]